MSLNPPEAPLLLRSEDAAKMLGVSMRTLYDLRAAGKITFVPVGRTGVRYAVAELQRFIADTQTRNEGSSNEN
jgi:excisionase family DNA binding protein